MFSLVTLANLTAASGFSEKWTAGELFSSGPSFAPRRSRPVMIGTLRTR